MHQNPGSNPRHWISLDETGVLVFLLSHLITLINGNFTD